MSRQQRPFTWGGARPGSSFSIPTSPGLGSSTFGFEPSVPDIYRRAWSVITSNTANDSFGELLDVDIHLGLLHKLLSSAGGLGAGSAEQIVNAACKGSRCSRTDFFIALGLLHQMQQGEQPNVHIALAKLAAGALSAPNLNLSALIMDSHTDHTFPPTAPSGLSTQAEARPAGPMREMSDPWNSSNGGSINGTSFHHYDGLPQQHEPASSYDSTFRGGFASNGSVEPSNRNVPTLGDNARTNHLFTLNESASTDTQIGFAGSSLLSSYQHAPTARQPKARQERPFSYMSDTADINAVDTAEDPSAELPEDSVTVRLRSELEGFIIKHNVYIVTSSFRKSEVTRRYSDWLWLQECLLKRYPFRCLPVLPPKRIAVPIAGRHLSAGDLFIERRRRGLERFLRMLTCHPILREDKLVEVFFTEQRPIAEWKSSAPALFLDEEGLVKTVDEAERMSIPEDLELKLKQQRQAIPELLDRWTAMVALFERIVKRYDAAAADYSRLNFSLLSVIETSSKRWRPGSDTSKKTEEIMSTAAAIFQDHSDMTSSRVSATSLSTLEGMKAQRDLILSFHDLIARIDRQLVDPIDTLKKRIEACQKKITTIAASGANNASTQHEQATLSAQVKQDTHSIQKYLNRRIHAKKTIWEELVWFHHRFKAVEENLQKFVRDETFFLQTLTRVWETTEMKLKMVR
ncbi:related to Sorting nexin MVP1 [Melanopsichium pennsylvanicum]|uniref:Sorting nexin MVP1 n=2 Tax=Melanopsichium pennsylvanicum TaxID=63383 RepID=A0AAJ4XIL4_9BASI|nr:related to Sorting nexin MVP1 [Melanopsichium pennsylvanicum 4]SNX81818.1 related to Sorting nexin MVP1 [Melanopsichium pennsylvanicum]